MARGSNPPLIQRWNSPWAAVLIVAIAYATFVALRLAKHDYDVSRFVTAGDEFCDPSQVPAGLFVFVDSSGYDGQYYYRLALDPLTSEAHNLGVTLDLPAYRQQRILYPLIVRTLSLGHATLVPGVMVLVNFLALCGMAWIASRFSQSLQRHALWGLLIPFYPGFVLTLARDLTEIVEVFFLLAALWCLVRDRQLAGGVLLACAVLAKETALIALVAIVGTAAIQQWRQLPHRHFRWPVFVIPIVTCCAWQLFLWQRWDQLPLLAGRGNLGLPLAGISSFVTRLLGEQRAIHDYWLGLLVFLAVFCGYLLASLRASSLAAHVKVTWLSYLGLALLLTPVVWVEHWAFLRALSEFYVLGALLLLSSTLRGRPFLAAYAAITWLVVMRGARH